MTCCIHLLEKHGVLKKKVVKKKKKQRHLYEAS